MWSNKSSVANIKTPKLSDRCYHRLRIFGIAYMLLCLAGEAERCTTPSPKPQMEIVGAGQMRQILRSGLVIPTANTIRDCSQRWVGPPAWVGRIRGWAWDWSDEDCRVFVDRNLRLYNVLIGVANRTGLFGAGKLSTVFVGALMGTN